MRKETKEKLESLKEVDVYSLLLFALYKLKDRPEYSTLSELSYILDKGNLLKFLEYFGGTTINVPTVKEFKLMVQALILYQYVNIEGIVMSDALKLINETEYQIKDVKECYYKLLDVVNNYSFGRN